MKLNSYEWMQKLGILQSQILDPDGWDRSNFKKSMEEEITIEEFWHRFNLSTTTGHHDSAKP